MWPLWRYRHKAKTLVSFYDDVDLHEGGTPLWTEGVGSSVSQRTYLTFKCGAAQAAKSTAQLKVPFGKVHEVARNSPFRRPKKRRTIFKARSVG